MSDHRQLRASARVERGTMAKFGATPTCDRCSEPDEIYKVDAREGGLQFNKLCGLCVEDLLDSGNPVTKKARYGDTFKAAADDDLSPGDHVDYVSHAKGGKGTLVRKQGDLWLIDPDGASTTQVWVGVRDVRKI